MPVNGWVVVWMVWMLEVGMVAIGLYTVLALVHGVRVEHRKGSADMMSEKALKGSFDADGGSGSLAAWLMTVSGWVDPDEIGPGEEEATIDVRLRYFDGDWYTYSGDSRYDQDHRGYWGSSCVGADLSEDGAKHLAKTLYGGVVANMATCGALSGEGETK